MALQPVADALAQVLEGVAPLGSEQVPLDHAEGRVLAENLAARRLRAPARARRRRAGAPCQRSSLRKDLARQVPDFPPRFSTR